MARGCNAAMEKVYDRKKDMITTILHLSDLHFGDAKAVLNRDDVSRVLGSLLAKAGPDVTIVLSGDISFKGQSSGYGEANQALMPFVTDGRVARHRIIACPGNHDIVNTASAISPFQAFDAWSAGIRHDKHCTFSDRPCRLIKCGAVDYLVINSAYHCEHAYGLVDLKELDGVLSTMGHEMEPGSSRVAVLHHHLIPFSGRLDESTTRNSYQLLSRLIDFEFSLVLHGHQHALLQLDLGRLPMKLCGVGSFRYSTPGFTNGAAIIRIDGRSVVSTEHYAISKDASDFLRALKKNC